MDQTVRQAEPAGEVETVAVEPVNKAARRTLYAARPRIHPKRAYGTFRRVKWLVMAATLGVYYGAPWLRWDRGANAPDQAILLDFPARRFYFLFIEIWPHEVYYLTGLLILAALGLFLVTSIAGRVWCGYTCPQTVWTDLFLVVERAVEGDRNARIRLDRAPWTGAKIARRTLKHAVWLLIGAATGGAWVFYFADAPTLVRQLLAFEAPQIAYLFIGVFTLTTYTLGGLAREQVCTYMCPWPRIQGAMLDEHSLVVTYHARRGEPRGPHRKGEPWDGRGHCIDCNQCVVVCPMGIDIRDGQQLECITCALCIDACNGVMDKVGLPRGLISYDTLANLEAEDRGGGRRFTLWRARTLIYLAAIAATGLVMLAALASRPALDLTVLRDRNPLFVRLADGGIRNGYTVKILNKRHEPRTVALAVEGLPGAVVSVIGADPSALAVPPDALRAFRVYVAVPADALDDDDAPVRFRITAVADGTEAAVATVFRGPER